jgi:hypothetical protein
MRTFHENVLFAAVFPPAAWADGTVPATYIDMSDYERIVFLILTGAMATGETVAAQVVQATDSAGTGSKDITGATITDLTLTDDNALATIEVRDTALDVENSFRYVSLTIDETGSPPFGCVIALLYKGGGLPPTQPATYVEQIEVS